MKKSLLLLISICSIAIGCGTVPPEKYFSIASLNCNLLFGFAGAGMQRELASPSEKLVDPNTYATEPMKRAEVVQTKIDLISANFEKVKDLPVVEDAKEMIEASLALYEFALPVYKNEYRDLAELYDNNASSDQIATLEKLISDKYSGKFEALYNAVVTAGTMYATKNNIPVQTVNPAPPKVSDNR